MWNVKRNKFELDLDHVLCCVSSASYNLVAAVKSQAANGWEVTEATDGKI
jgi:hypothetical protein